MKNAFTSITDRLSDPEFRKKFQSQADAATKIVARSNGYHNMGSLRRALSTDQIDILKAAPLTSEQANSCLTSAINNKSRHCAHYLLNHGANKHYGNGQNFEAAAISDDYLTLVMIFTSQSDLNDFGHPSLISAIKHGKKTSVQFLIEQGVPLHQNNGQVLTTAIKSNQPEILEILLDYFTNINTAPLQELTNSLRQQQYKTHLGISSYGDDLIKTNEIASIIEKHQKRYQNSVIYLEKTRLTRINSSCEPLSKKIQNISDLFKMTASRQQPIFNKIQQTSLNKRPR